MTTAQQADIVRPDSVLGEAQEVNARAQPSRPTVIFCRDALARDYSPLTALIAGELIYWISHKGKRWARYRDYAELFQVSERTVIRQRRHLEQIFIITPTTMTKGNRKMRGANQYQLKAECRGLLWAEALNAPATDYEGKVAAFPLVFVKIGQMANGGNTNIDLSWFLCRLANIIHHHSQGRPATFQSWAALESRTQTPARTAKRYLAQAESAGLIKTIEADQPVVGVPKKAAPLLLGPFAAMDKQRDQRAAQSAEARLWGMLSHLWDSQSMYSGSYEELVDWYDRLCQREFGHSLTEYYARLQGWTDEDGNGIEYMGFDALMG